jgi:biotin carboxylase
VTAEARPHVVIVNRWRERYAEYARYIDHARYDVAYVSTDVGAAAVPAEAAAVACVERTNDLDALRGAVRGLAQRLGAPAEIIALKEDDLLVTAQLRAEWGCPGQRPDDLLWCLDKHRMYDAVARAGLPVPPFVLAHDEEEVAAFAERHGWPVVLKPRLGGASEGVAIVHDPLRRSHHAQAAWPLLVQAFNPHPVYHTDGLFLDGDLALFRSSRYIHTCLDFRHGQFLGSVEEDDPRLNRALKEATLGYLRALTSKPTVFHLELFVDATDRAAPDIAFLELGARVGGGENALVWREVHGIDLMEMAFRLHRGLPPFEGDAPRLREDVVTGQVYIPSPLPRPCRITEVSPSMLDRPDGPYAESVPQPGEVLPGTESYYEHVGGRFRFRGGSTREVEEAILATAEGFRVAAEPVEVEGMVS